MPDPAPTYPPLNLGHQYTEHELRVVGSNKLVIGTAMLGDQYGEVIACTVKRTNDTEEVKSPNGNLRAVIFSNMRKEITLETRFDLDVPCPEFGDILRLPGIGVEGHIVEASVTMGQGKERRLNITATEWDVLRGATAYTLHTQSGVYA